jgi:hypothetical protein
MLLLLVFLLLRRCYCSTVLGCVVVLCALPAVVQLLV